MSGFLDNQQYVITVDDGVTSSGSVNLGSDQQYSFVSNLEPYVGIPQMVYGALVGFIPSLNHMDVCIELFRRTYSIWGIAGAFIVDPVILSGTGSIYHDDLICYVNNSVIAHLLRVGYLGTMGGGITLGDLSVKEPNYSNVAPLVKEYELAAEICFIGLNLGRKAMAVVKGENRAMSPGLGAMRSWSHRNYPNQRRYPGYRRGKTL